MLDRRSIAVLIVCAAACGSSSGSGNSIAPSASPAPLLTITEVTTATVVAGGGSPLAVGQSVTVPQPNSFNGIRFTWLDRQGNGISAQGTMQIYTREYLGTLQDMGPSAPGFLARSVRTEGSDYVFDDSVTLTSGFKYWFLDEAPNHVTVFLTQPAPDIYPGGDFYSATAGSPYSRLYRVTLGDDLQDANFRLTGRPISR